ncbi:hypothetical protein PAHAL_8G100800 [Panicum hallii]|uniref:Wall-associated receptor kinase galacturonan-binding domain-containing protein n=1 Tax=Panicum hallii TaxID=206008 RepID=A0A2S3IDM2_9POAL|nr:hypothetical protein PAHAL_8G100800 [Panicum hallii]
MPTRRRFLPVLLLAIQLILLLTGGILVQGGSSEPSGCSYDIATRALVCPGVGGGHHCTRPPCRLFGSP